MDNERYKWWALEVYLKKKGTAVTALKIGNFDIEK